MDRPSSWSARSDRARRAIVAATLALVAFAGLGGTAAADPSVKVAVLPFNGPGPQAKRAAEVAAAAARREYTVVSQKEWDASAKKLFATSHSADDIAAVANDLGVGVVVTGAIKNDSGWILVVSVRYGPTGKAVEKLRYDLKGPKVDTPTLKQMATDLPGAIEKAKSGEGSSAGGENANAGGESGGNTGAATTPTKSDEEAAPLAEKKPPAEEKPAGERPDYAPFIDFVVGLPLQGRNFGFDQQQPPLPAFHSVLAAGLHLDASLFPLAFLARQPGAAMNAVQGLGVGATFDYQFWPDSVPCNRDPNTGSCATTTEHYGTTEYRFEAGLRWHWNILAQAHKPELTASLQYGLHNFAIQKKPDGTDVGPPDVAYSYLSLGVGGKLPFIPQLAAFANFHFHIVLDNGPINATAEFGPGGGWGLRVDGGLEARPLALSSGPAKGFIIRLIGVFEHFDVSFNNKMPTAQNAKSSTGDASDNYYGATIALGYMY